MIFYLWIYRWCGLFFRSDFRDELVMKALLERVGDSKYKVDKYRIWRKHEADTGGGYPRAMYRNWSWR